MKKVAAPEKKENRLLRYFREVRAEIRKVVWPSRRTTTRLTAIVFGVTAIMSMALGLVDWVFAKLITLILG
ncbi:MAG: preprotein translocase subunit SecE [Anaerolineae bacterium]